MLQSPPLKRIHLLQSIFRYFRILRHMYDTFLYHRIWITCVCLPKHFLRSFKYDLHFENPTTTKMNIWANIFYETKALTSTFNINFAGLSNHMFRLLRSTGTRGYGSPFGFGTLVLPVCRMERSYLWIVLTHVCRIWRCCSSYSTTHKTH